MVTLHYSCRGALIEIFIGALLVSRYNITIAANIAIALIVVFTAYIMLHYGAAENCGCYGDIISVGYDKYAVYKNAILLMGFIYLNYRESHRNVPRNKTAEAL